MSHVRSWQVAVILVLAAACDNSLTTAPPRIKGPVDIVVAGPTPAGGYPIYAFVAGQEADSVYVVDLRSLLLVTSPNEPLFPLEIPTCRSPSALGASRNGLYVVVACSADNTAQLIDATTLLRVRDANNVPVSIPIGRGSERMLLLDPEPDGNDHFVSINSYEQSLTFLHLDAAAKPPTLVVDRNLPVAAHMERGVIDGNSLVTADPTSTFVHRIDLTTGAVTSYDVGYASVDVDVSVRGGDIYAATPETEGITVIDGVTGETRDTDPVYAPLVTDDVAYTGIYVGELPKRVHSLQSIAGQVLDLTCSLPPAEQLPSPSNVALIATETGPVYYVNAADDEQQPQLITTTSCAPTTVVATDTTDNTTFVSFVPFEACAPTTRKSRPCDARTGVTYYPGHTGALRVTLKYEALLPNASRDNGGGTLSLDGTTIRDAVNNYTQLLGTGVSVQVGDRVIITSAPNVSPAICRTTYGEESDKTLREFGVAGVTSDGDLLLDTTTFDPTLLAQCFPSGPKNAGQLAYDVRIGQGFLVTAANPASTQQLVGRVNAGATFGENNQSLVRFTVKPLSPTFVFLRDSVIDFTVTDQYQPLRAGQTTPNASTTLPFPAGRVPGGIIVANSGNGATQAFRAFVTYSASDTIAVWQAFDSVETDPSLTLILQ